MTTPGELWASFTHDPRVPANAGLRAADRDRDLIRSALADAFAEGRLDREEFDERSDRVAAARTLGELPPLVTDLVPEHTPEPRRGAELATATPDELRLRAGDQWQAERRQALLSFLGPTLICWTIWVATSFGDGGFEPYFPWPLIVMAATGIHLVSTVLNRGQGVEEHLRRLEKQQAKELKARGEPGNGQPS